MKFLALSTCLAVIIWAGIAKADACIPDLCTKFGYTNGQVIWENSFTGERIVGACVPDAWWPGARVTCMVDGKPIPELEHNLGPGSGWIGATLRSPGQRLDSPQTPDLQE